MIDSVMYAKMQTLTAVRELRAAFFCSHAKGLEEGVNPLAIVDGIQLER